jgi:hypothetical protein
MTRAQPDLRNRLTFDAQANKKGSDLCRRGFALHDLPHSLRGFLFGQILLLNQLADRSHKHADLSPRQQ